MTTFGPRHRTFDKTSSNGTVTLTTTTKSTGSKSIANYDTPEIVLRDHTMDDFVVPGFRSRSAAGEIFNNPMYHYKRTRQSGGGSFSYSDAAVSIQSSGLGSLTAFESNYGSYLSYPNHISSAELDAANLNRIAMQQALASVDSTPYQFMEDAAEIGATLRLLRNPLEVAINLARTFERDYIKRRKRNLPHAKALADAWMTSRYGFRPLAYSIENAYNVFAGKNFNAPPPRRTSRGSRSASIKREGSYQKQIGTGSVDTYVWADEMDYEIRAGILYEVSSPLMNTFDLLGFRGKDIPRTVYNLMPYSWLIDRAVNLGNVTSALMNLADPRVKILAAWTTESLQTVSVKQWTGAVRPNAAVSVTGDSIVDTEMWRRRSPWTPTTADAEPVVELRVDASVITDLVSLFLQRIKLGSFSSR